MKPDPFPDRVDGSDADRESGKVTELFHRCLDLPPEQHDGFLERSCGDDPELRRQLERLLRADAEAGSFLREPFYTPPSDMAPAGESSSQVLELLWGGTPARQLDLGELATGVVLADRYRIVGAIGSGGMGAVYRAEDLKIGQTVALKLLHPTLQQCEHTLRRFLDEVRIARQITDTNVCRVYDVVEAGGLHFISMEYIAGQNLDDLLRRGEGLALEQATDLARQICRGLAAAHRAGVLHRDLKPANLMIDPEGTVKVTDFGLAAAGGRVTGREARNGTPAYMAPEQRTGREATVQSDLYALGVVLHQLFTGTRPDADGPQARIELPQGIQAVIDQCLQHDPQDRPDSVEAVTRAFCDEVETAVRTLVVIRGAEPDTATEAILADASIEGLLRRYRGRRIGGAPDLLLFERPADAIRFALDGHRRLALDERSVGVAIHLVEIATLEATAARLTRASFAGCELEIAATLSSLARGRQTLITRGAFDLARSHSIPGFENVSWLAHGSYEIEGLAMPLAICEVGVGGFAPLQKPRESTRVRPQIIQPTLTGWRPAPGLNLPQRDRWVLERKLGEGGFGEVWLARHRATPEQRIFKFCYDPTSLRTLKREITLFKLLKETLGERRDISRILDWNFDHAPYYIEAEFTVGGSLDQWVREQGGLSAVPLAVRLEIVAQVATALAAAHSVGVLHKDVKPANVLITGGADGRVQAKLSDFGLGLLTERERLAEVGVTALGFTEMISEVLSGSSQAGTRLYMAPELLEGKAATLQSDLYALGIMLYQMVVGDLSRALAPGWERDIDDPLLVEDISLAVDGDAERRLDSGLRLAERLRQLAQRRQREEQRRQELAEARQATEALARARRRWKFAVAGLLVLALFAATVLFQARRIAQEAAATEAVSDFITDFMVILDPINGRQQKLNPRLVLEATIEKIDTDLQDQPKTQAKLLLEVGTVLLSLGNQKEAEQLLRRAVEMNRQWAGRHPERLADALHNLADVLRQLGELEEASAAVDEALALRRRIGDQAAIARSLALRGLVSHHQVDTAAAEVDFREALRLGEANGAEAEFIAETTVRLGVLLRGTRRYEEALTSFEKARASYVSMFGPEHAKIAFCDQFSAEVLAAIGQVEQAERLQWQALKMRESIFESPHPEIAHSYLSLGNFLGRQGHFEAGERAIEQALVGYRSLGIGHPYVAAALHDLSALYEAQGRIEEARTAMMEALEIRISAHGEEGPMTLHSREVLARLETVSR